MDFQKKTRILKFTLIFQGLYYFLKGLWAIVSLESFSRITGHYGEPFEMHSIAAIALVIGLFLLWSAFKEELRRHVGFLVLGLVLAIMIPELIYLPKMGNPILFWIDFIEEGTIGLLVAFSLFSKPTKSRDRENLFLSILPILLADLSVFLSLSIVVCSQFLRWLTAFK